VGGRNRGGSLPKKWGGRTTPFFAKGWLRPPHIGCIGVAEATPRPLGVVRPSQKATKKKKKNGRMGWLDHPQEPKPIARSFIFLFFLAFWGGRTTPKGLGVAEATPISFSFFKIFFNLIFFIFLLKKN
jgi:hypothetical protein